MIELRINYDEQTGNVNVNGPVGNKGLCYMLLECARDAVKDHVDKTSQQPPPQLMPTPIPNGRLSQPPRVKRRR